MYRKIIIHSLLACFMCVGASKQVASQTLQDWANTVHWDGVSHWSKYISMLPAHMGPNALPIPATGNGNVDNRNWAGAGLQFHFSKGDRSQSILLEGNYSLVKDVISFQVSYIPAEFYSMSDTMKKQRHVYYEFYNDKKARGDVLLNMNIRLLKKWDRSIQLALRIGYRYPSSNGLGAARFTDNMGYWVDLSAGKPLGTGGWKWIGMAGFYCWQIDKGDLRQDDAFLFGMGLEWERKDWKLQTSLAGYLGYLEDQGDKPIVVRTSLEKKLGHSVLLLRLQQGLHDYKYSKIEFGARYLFK